MKTFIASAALALTLTAPAFANDQLAASVGVEAGQYTLSELAGFVANRANDDGIDTAPDLVTVSTRSTVSAGHAQLAASLGVDAGQYSLSDLAGIIADRATDDGINGGSDFVSVSTRGTVSGGHAQLAASLGVDAGAYSVADLAGIIADRASDDSVN